jgi:malonyl-CoA O-methyltransferase
MESTLMIDKKRVSHAFGSQANEYEHHASVQKRVLTRFVRILKNENMAPRRLLDVGSGTGMLLRSLRDIYGEVFAVGVDHALGMNLKAREGLETAGRTQILAADAELLPFPGSTFDLVLSTSTFQWLNELDSAFEEVFRVLAPGGLFCFALFGEKTLHELRASYRSALVANRSGNENRVHIFPSRTEVKAALLRAGFTECRVSTQMETEIHDDVPSLLRSLKRIGAGNASPISPRGLAGKRVMLDMMQRYKNEYGDSSGISASYEIIYGLGRKS